MGDQSEMRRFAIGKHLRANVIVEIIGAFVVSSFSPGVVERADVETVSSAAFYVG